MYKKMDYDQLEFENFYLPFGGKLRSDNRWIRLSQLIPWNELEDEYAVLFSKKHGAPAKPFRMALGALIIKEKLGISDEETVEHIKENPYLQYFIGLNEFQDEAPFDSSMMVYFRKRLSEKILSKINDKIVKRELEKNKDERNQIDRQNNKDGKDTIEESGKNNSGIMMVDASVTPADIAYPTDLNLLNKSRENLEEIIDVLYEPIKTKISKPRTYRQKARKDYLLVSKRRRAGKKRIKRAIRQQLQYIRRDLGHINALLEKGSDLCLLDNRQYKNLLVNNEIYRQQLEMFQNQNHSTKDRIVNIYQPHVRPIVRGKVSANVEFGAKIVAARYNGYHILENLSWDNVNEATLLKSQIEHYKEFTGCYPEAVLADKIYRNRENITFCKKHNIRLLGPKLGRPKKDSKVNKKQERIDSAMRNAIEGTFGTGKRRYGWNRIMMKLRETSESSISTIVLIMNLEKVIKNLFAHFFYKYFTVPKIIFFNKIQAF